MWVRVGGVFVRVEKLFVRAAETRGPGGGRGARLVGPRGSAGGIGAGRAERAARRAGLRPGAPGAGPDGLGAGLGRPGAGLRGPGAGLERLSPEAQPQYRTRKVKRVAFFDDE